MSGNRKNDKVTKINPNARLSKIEPKSDAADGLFKCSCCGKAYKRQQGNFTTSLSPIYKGNDGFLTTCRNCVDALFKQYKEFYSDDDLKALEHICRLFDIYFDENVWTIARVQGTSQSRIGNYFKQLNLVRSRNKTLEYGNATYTDYLLRKWAEDIKNATSFEQIEAIDNPDLDTDSVKFWGLGWVEKDYANLNNFYNDWVTEYGDPPDKTTKELYKALCFMQVQMQAVTMSGDGNLSTLIKQYRETLDAAGLKPSGKTDSEVRIDPIGVWVEQIENYTPADFYKNKKLYKDSDGIGGYFERFILRPFRNTFFGTNEKDKEFSLTNDESEE